jgi:hypothetical protein
MNDSIVVDQKEEGQLVDVHQQQQSADANSSTPAQVTSSGDYEKSVTEKENLLLGSFNVKSLSCNTNNSSDSSNLQPTTNGKTTSELIIDDALISSQANGHKNGSIDNNML